LIEVKSRKDFQLKRLAWQAWRIENPGLVQAYLAARQRVMDMQATHYPIP